MARGYGGQVSNWNKDPITERALTASTNQIVVSDSTALNGFNWVDDGGIRASVDMVDWVIGYWYAPGRLTASYGGGSANVIRATPFFIPKTTSFDRIGIYINGTAVSGLVRLGIYSIVNSVPSSLLVDSGDINAASSGSKEATISLTLNRGWYAVAANKNNNSITYRLVTTGPNLGTATSLSLDTASPWNHWEDAETYGALPSTFAVSGYERGAAPAVNLRVA